MSATWQDLPAETKLQIVQYATVIDRTSRPSSAGFPTIPELANLLRSVDQATRECFSDTLQKDNLHIRIYGCRCLANTEFARQLENNLHRNRRTPDITVYERSLELDLSILEFDIMCSPSCEKRGIHFKPFLATTDMMLIVFGLLGRRAETRVIELTTKCRTLWARDIVKVVLDLMRWTLHSTYIMPTSTLPDDYDLKAFQRVFGRPIATPKDLVMLLESRLDAFQYLLHAGVPL